MKRNFSQTTAQHAPWPRTSRLAIVPDNIAIHDDGMDTFGQRNRILIGCDFVNGLFIKKRQIREGTLFNHTAISQTKIHSRQASHFMYGRFKRKQA